LQLGGGKVMDYFTLKFDSIEQQIEWLRDLADYKEMMVGCMTHDWEPEE
jgi:hypothetical protein